MDGTLMLVLLSITMFIGSFVSGLIPLTLTLSESKMRLVTIVGAGLLVGTALAVIIPEGVHTLYKNDLKTSHDHQDVHKRNMIEDNVVQLQKRSDEKKLIGLSENAKIQNKLVDPNGNQVDAHDHAIHGEHDQNDTEKHEHGSDSHSSIGLTLVLGFIFMLIVDQIGGKLHHTTSLDPQAARSKITFTTTLGLVIHAAVDGLALGAAAASTQTDIEMIVFAAIMLHKVVKSYFVSMKNSVNLYEAILTVAPASFGLVSFLLHEGLDRSRARRHLIVFALAAPIMAIITFFSLNMQSHAVVSSNSTGLCMLFSAGTFLYVSTIHVLPEIQGQNENKQFKTNELACLIFGACLPLVLSVGHSH